jgi:glycine amidinotransferase
MHIDTTFVPLAPGRVLVNPDYLDVEKLPRMFKSWEVLVAPRPDPVDGSPLLRLTSMCGDWLSINVLSLDGRRVICERHQHSLIRALREWGFEPIPLPFIHYAPFGGSFHCATLDVRRRGELQSYF